MEKANVSNTVWIVVYEETVDYVSCEHIDIYANKKIATKTYEEKVKQIKKDFKEYDVCNSDEPGADEHEYLKDSDKNETKESFEIYENGYYGRNHATVYIEEKTVITQ